MASVQTVWGIDVGRCALKALKVRLGPDGSVEIIAHDYIEHAKILSQPDADSPALIAGALEKFLSRNDITKDKVVVCVPGQHTLARFTKLPPVAPKRIPDIVRYEADQQIPFDMDEVIWDYQTFEQEGLPDIEVGIFAMKRELLREHLLHFEQVGIEPIAVQSGPLALYNAAHCDELLGSETTVLLDIGAENTDLVIATPGSLWTRTIPIGGNNFTEGLVKSFKLSFAKAENLKRTADTSKYRRQIFQAMRPIFADLVQELQRSIGFYSSTHREAEIDKVVGLGNAFKLPGLKKYLQQNLGLPVEVPGGFKKAGGSAAAAETLKEERLSFFVAYGLTLQGVDLAPVTSNLLPAEIAKQTVWRKKKPTFAAAAACLLLAGGVVWFRQTADTDALAAAAAGAENVEVVLAEAASIIDNGPSRSLPPRTQAATIREACRSLKSELNKLTSQGQAEREETEKLIELQRNKTLVSRIAQVVHESVPVPDGPLGQVSSASEVRAAIAGGAPPRGQRKQVFINSLQMQFEPDLNGFDWPESLVKVPPRINDDEEATLPGFELKIKCRTPNQDGVKFINEGFMEPLRNNGRRPGTGFYFDRVWLVDGGEIGHKEQDDRGGGRRGFGRGGGGRPGQAGGASAVPPEDRDPITDEPAFDDWEFDIWVDVILEDYPESEEEEESDIEGEEE